MAAATTAALAVATAGGVGGDKSLQRLQSDSPAAYWTTSTGQPAANNNNGLNNGGQLQVGSESGFINSQPSMAEFLTHLGPESPSGKMQSQTVGGGVGGNSVNAFIGQLTDVNGGGGGGVGGGLNSMDNGIGGVGCGGIGGVNVNVSGAAVPEYPWMKEKKTARSKNGASGGVVGGGVVVGGGIGGGGGVGVGPNETGNYSIHPISHSAFYRFSR